MMCLSIILAAPRSWRHHDASFSFVLFLLGELKHRLFYDWHVHYFQLAIAACAFQSSW